MEAAAAVEKDTTQDVPGPRQCDKGLREKSAGSDSSPDHSCPLTGKPAYNHSTKLGPARFTPGFQLRLFAVTAGVWVDGHQMRGSSANQRNNWLSRERNAWLQQHLR